MSQPNSTTPNANPAAAPQWVLRPFEEGKEILQRWADALQINLPAVTQENYASLAQTLLQQVASQNPDMAAEMARSLLAPPTPTPLAPQIPAATGPESAVSSTTGTSTTGTSATDNTSQPPVTPDPWQATRLNGPPTASPTSQTSLEQAQAQSMWPLYHLLREKGALAAAQGVQNHHEACEKLAQVLKQLPHRQQEAVLLKLVNPYGLNYGQPALKKLNERYAQDTDFKARVDQQRSQAGLSPWPALPSAEQTTLVQRFQTSFQQGSAPERFSPSTSLQPAPTVAAPGPALTH